MKTRTFITLLIAMYVLLAVACVRVDDVRTGEGKRTSFGAGIYVWTDPDVGCDYVVSNGDRKTAITPKLNRDGTPYCPGL